MLNCHATYSTCMARIKGHRAALLQQLQGVMGATGTSVTRATSRHLVDAEGEGGWVDGKCMSMCVGCLLTMGVVVCGTSRPGPSRCTHTCAESCVLLHRTSRLPLSQHLIQPVSLLTCFSPASPPRPSPSHPIPTPRPLRRGAAAAGPH
jgi:hypothetical protein